jgi:hypothetical protein
MTRSTLDIDRRQLQASTVLGGCQLGSSYFDFDFDFDFVDPPRNGQLRAGPETNAQRVLSLHNMCASLAMFSNVVMKWARYCSC